MSGNSSRKGPWWQLFEETGTKFGNNSSYKNAWCKGCTQAHVGQNRERDLTDMALGNLSEPRPEAELKRIAFGLKAFTAEELQQHPLLTRGVETSIEPVYGRASSMAAHAWKCPNLVRTEVERVSSEAEREKVAEKRRKNAKAATQANSENVPPGSSSITTNSGSPPLKRRRIDAPQSSVAAPTAFTPIWDENCQEAFAKDLCKVFIASSIAWNVADHPEFRLFFSKWLPKANLPDRRALSGQYLDSTSDDARDKTVAGIKSLQSKLAMGQSDGWKTAAKTNVTSTVMSVEYEKPYLVATHNMTGKPKTGDYMYELIKSDLCHMQETYEVEVVGWCTDDGPDGKKARRLLRENLFYLIVVLCWAHQMNLIVGDLLGVPWVAHTVRMAVEIITWFNNHGVALELLRQEQSNNPRPDRGGRIYSLLRPVATRWTSHLLAITRILLLRSDLQPLVLRNSERLIQSVGNDQDVIQKVHQVIANVRNETFWTQLARIEQYLRPLAVAANVTQGSDTRLDHVLLTLGQLYKTFSSAPDMDESVRDRVLASLEARWKAADQDVFILALFLNPYIRGTCFNRNALPPLKLIHMARVAFKRFFGQDTGAPFIKALTAYSNRQGDYSDANLFLTAFREEAIKNKERVDIKLVWEALDPSPGTVCPTAGGIAQLAVRLFSVIPNTGDTERVFSDFGITHTKRRSRLSPEKMHKATLVKMHLRRSSEYTEPSPIRNKRHFGTDAPTTANASLPSHGLVNSQAYPTPPSSQQPSSSITPPSAHASTSSTPRLANPSIRTQVVPPVHPDDFDDDPDLEFFDHMTGELTRQARRSWDDLVDEPGEETPRTSEISHGTHPDSLLLPDDLSDPSVASELQRRINAPSHRNPKTNIPLSKLFVYATLPINSSNPNQGGLDFFWAHGEHCLEQEQVSIDPDSVAEV